VNRSPARHAWIGACVLVLAGCAGTPVRPPALPDVLADRRAEIGAVAQFRLSGRVALSDGKDAVTLRVEWAQSGDRSEITLHAPVTGERVHLVGDGREARIETSRGVRKGRSLETLLARQTPYRIPVDALVDWVRGLSHVPGRADVVISAETGLPLSLGEGDWCIRYRDFDLATTPALPRLVDAERGAYRVRLAIADWHAGEGHD